MRAKWYLFIPVLAACWTGMTPFLYAQPAENDGDRTGRRPPTKPFFVELSYTPSLLFRSDFSDAPGSARVRHHDVSATLIVPIANRGRLNLTASHDRHQYRFRGNPVLEGVLEDAYTTRIGAVYMGRLSAAWSIFGMAGIETAAEEGASKSNAQVESAMFIIQRQWTDALQLGLGLIASSRLDESNQYIPTLSITWDITERWTIQTTRGIRLLYYLDKEKKWRAGFNNEFLSRHIRLNDESETANGVFRSRSFVSTLSLVYRPNPGVTLGAEIGIVPWREIRLRDRNKDTIFESNSDIAVSAAFTTRMVF